MTEGILILNAEGVITSFSRGFEEIFGYGGWDVKGRDCSFLFAEDGKPECAALMESIRKGDGLNESAARLIRKDGASLGIYLSAYPLKDTEGRPSSSTLVLRVRKTQTVPGILSEEFNRIFKFSNDAVAITDLDGNIIDVNQAFSETYGYTREEAFGKNPRILKPQHSKKEMYEKMWADILDPKRGFWRGEMINAAKDGREVPVLLSINAIKDEDGEIRNFLWIAYNMSRQKELDRIRKMYVDYVIHDIRGPLTTISINSELLLKQLENIPEKTRRKITMIIESARRINDMTLDVLDFSRAQSGALPISKEKVDVGKLLRQALSPFENSGKKLLINGGIYEENAPGGFFIEADPNKLQRVIYNLLSNAFKYAATEVRVEVEFNSGGLKFIVADDGKGISKEEGERIFEAFYQTDEGVKTGGAGLGLSIVKSFVEAHGGNVWVDSGQEKGVTFGFFMPS